MTETQKKKLHRIIKCQKMTKKLIKCSLHFYMQGVMNRLYIYVNII
jgi:hypothetical protein